MAAALLAGMGTSAVGQVGEPIVVTGERLERTEAQTSSSVAVATGEDIEAASGADRLDQLLANIPNVQLGSGGEGPTIRGQDTTGVLRDLPAFLGGARPRATLQVDGRAVTYNEFAFGTAPLWDVEQIEVFRSPQTTTQGRNSIAGAIFIETADPTFEVEARARLLAASRDTRQVSVALSGPIVADQLAVRLAGDVRRGRPSTELTSPAPDVDPNSDDYSLLRLKLLATPEALPGLRLLGTYLRSGSLSPQIEGVEAPFEERRDLDATYGIFETDVESLTARAEQSLTADLTVHATGSLGWADIQRHAPVGFGQTRIDAKDQSIELVLDWSQRPGLTAVAGIHASGHDLAQEINLAAARLGEGSFTDKQSSLGLFGEIEWEFVPRLHLTAGARYQRDRQIRTGSLLSALREIRLAYDHTFEAFLPKVSLSYDIAPDSRVGVLAQRAYNPGGTTLSLATFLPDTFEAEKLWDYELFARTSLAGGKLQLAANLFYYSIDDAQRSLLQALPTPGGTVFFAETSNAPAAWSRGAELQMEWRPIPSLTLDAAVGLLRTRLTQTLVPNDPILGQEFQRSPHLTASAAIAWRPATALLLTAQARHHSAYYSEDANDPARRVPAATIIDARAQWTQGALSLFGYVRNVFDSFRLTYLFSSASRLATAEDPREIGAGIEARF